MKKKMIQRILESLKKLQFKRKLTTIIMMIMMLSVLSVNKMVSCSVVKIVTGHFIKAVWTSKRLQQVPGNATAVM